MHKKIAGRQISTALDVARAVTAADSSRPLGTKSRGELAAELKELRAASVSVQGVDASLEVELRGVTNQLKRLCGELLKSTEAERATWLPWSPGAGGKAGVPSSSRSSHELRRRRRPENPMRKRFSLGELARKSHERHVVLLELRRRDDRAAVDVWQNEGGSSSSSCETERNDSAAVDDRVVKRPENQ